MTTEQFNRLKEIGCFENLNEELLQDEVYRSTGIHYSDLSSVHSNDLSKINPQTAAAVREQMDNDPVIIMGNLFEYYLEHNTFPEDVMVVKDKPSMHDFMAQMIDYVMSKGLRTPEELAQIARKKGLWKSYKDDQLIEKMKEITDIGTDISNWIQQELHIASLDKPPIRITQVDQFKITQAAQKVKEEYFTESGDWEIFWQVPLTGLVDGVPCTIKIDRLAVDPVLQRIRIDDTKYTQRKATDWYKFFWYYGYWIQNYMYPQVTRWCLAKDWTFDQSNMGFIVGSHEEPMYPVRWVGVWDDILDVGEKGLKKNGKNIRSFTELWTAYTWHMTNEQFDYPYEYYKNDKQLTIPKL